MADARLQWRQLTQAQPNVAPLLAQAGRGFNDAAEAASNILGNYQAGQEAAGDQELARLLASATNQEELNALVNSDEVRGLRLSENGIGMLNAAQGNRVDWSNTRSQIDTRAGQLGIAQADLGIRQAAEGRRATTFADEQARQTFLRENAAAGLAAEDFTRQYGDTVGPISQTTSMSQRDLLARTLQAEAGNQGLQGMIDVGSVIRNRVASGQWGDSLESVIMAPGQFSAWNGVTGYVNGEQGQNMDFTPGQEAYAAADAILSGNYQSEVGNALNYYAVIPGVSERPSWANDSFQQRGAHYFGTANGSGSDGRSVQLGGANTPTSYTTQRESPEQAYERLLVESGLFSASDINTLQDPIEAAANTRTAEIEKQNQEILRESFATANQALLDNPEINTVEQLRNAVFSDERFTATENEARYNNLRGLINDDPGRLRPSVIEDPTTVASAVGAVEAANNAVESNPRYALFADADRLAATDDATVGENVAKRLGLENDDENPNGIFGFGEKGFDVNRLDRMIEDAARRNDVRLEVAAAAFIRAFDRDPTGRNTLDNRFDADTVDEIIQSIDQRDERDFREATRSVQVMEAEINQIRSQEQLLRAQLVQYPEGSPNRAAIQAQIDSLQTQLADAERDYSSAPSRN